MPRVAPPVSRVAQLLILAAASVTATACGSAQAAPSTAPSAAASTAQPVTIETAAAAYAALVAPLNARLGDLGQRAELAETLQDVRRISNDYARLHDEYAAGLRALAVPPTVRDKLLAAADAAEQVAVVQRRAALARPAEIRAVGQELAGALDEQRRRIDLLRSALELAPVD